MATDIPANKRPKHGSIPVTESQIEQLGGEIMARDPEGRSQSVFRIRFLSFFGVDLAVVVAAWDLIGVPYYHDGDLSHAKPEHILWALLLLKKYGDESEMATLAGGGVAVDEKTFRKWSKIFVHRIASIKYDVVCLLCRAVALPLFTALSLILLLFVASSTDLLGEAQGWRHWQ